MRKFLLIGGIVMVLVGSSFVAGYLGFLTPDTLTPGVKQVVDQENFAVLESENLEPRAFMVEVFVEDLFVPWSIVFTDPDRVLITERNGKVRVVEDGQLLEEPLAVFDEVSTSGEEGLMGLALDPDYEENGWLYFSLAYPRDGQLFVKVVRFKDEGERLSDEKILIDMIPAAKFHAGSRLGFGPDGKLYITTGDATDRQLAQEMESLAGKVLRLNADGSIPDDNPFGDSPIYTLGHRNSQGIDWHPLTGALYSTEHGPSIFDGPAGGDELNLLLAGENYGWPLVSHEKSLPDLEDPKLVFTPAVAPASAAFYRSNVFPQFQNNLFFGLLKGEGIMRVVFSEDSEEVILFEKLESIDVGRVRDVVEGPDGALYFSTSNRDGRAKARDGDDKIYRLIPVE